METKDAIASLTALGHATRLAAYRLLVEAGPAGRMAGDIGEALGVPGWIDPDTGELADDEWTRTDEH